MAEQKMSQETFQKIRDCETPEQLIELAKADGKEITKEQAEAFFAQMQDVELDKADLKAVAGGDNCTRCWCNNVSWDCWMN